MPPCSSRALISALLFAGVSFAQTPVILLSIDTLRADHLSAYGYTRLHTPNIDAFAEHGTVFTKVNSQIPLTLPSHTSLFTSTYPFENGVEENAEIVPAHLITLASVLHEHGYRTGAFIGSDLLAQRFKLDKGFDVYDSPFQPQANPYDQRVRRDASLVVRSASQWLNNGDGKAPFVFLHFFDLHAPYLAAPGKSSEPNQAGYDNEIEYVDLVLGRFRKMLIEKGWWDRSLVILLSDHGESLGEHGETSHGYFAYQSTLWVPLLIHWPKQAHAPLAVAGEAANLIDVAPTILDFLHVQAPSAFHGTSLLKASRHPVYSETVYAHDAFRWAALRGIRTEDFQYIDAPIPELYDLRTDPHEQNNIAQTNAVRARELRDLLHSLFFARPARSSIQQDHSAETAAALQSLGYVAKSSHSATGTNGPDPKERLPEYQAYERGLEALYDHHELRAIAILSELLKHDPVNTVARYYLGEAYLRLQRPADAVRQWKTALAQDPRYTDATVAIQNLQASKR